MGMIDGIYLLIGTNLGDRISNIDLALEKIGKNIGHISAISSVYETAAWGEQQQPAFYNIALRVATDKPPLLLMKSLQAIENKMGRIKVEKWKERIIDIDILYYHDQQIGSAILTIPHAEIERRRFALEPLCEISPDFVHPQLQKTNAQLLDECEDFLEVKKL